MKKIDMTGWIMAEHGVPDSRLTVIKEIEPHITPGGNRYIQYLCKCSCGNETIVRSSYLRNGNTKSCGCLVKEKLTQRNINNGEIVNVGDKFGHLTVIKDLGMRKQVSRNKNWRWSLCQCDCGSDPIEVPNNQLRTGQKKSCGCLTSLGEETIEKVLRENSIHYIKEYSFSDLRDDISHRMYRFDFAIFENDILQYLIEFDGSQHYVETSGSWKNKRTLEDIQRIDEIKNDYCRKNNIKLKRIPYFNLSYITFDNIISDKWDIN